MLTPYLTSYGMYILSTTGRAGFLLFQAGVPIHMNPPAGFKVKLVSSNVITSLLVKGAVEPVVATFTPRLHFTTCYMSIWGALQKG